MEFVNFYLFGIIDFNEASDLLTDNFADYFGYQVKSIPHIDDITGELAVA